MGVSLTAVTNNGHRFALDQAQVAVFVVINFHIFLLVKTNKFLINLDSKDALAAPNAAGAGAHRLQNSAAVNGF